MARTSVTTQPIVKTGVVSTLTAADAVNGEVIDTGRVYLHVHNGGGAPITVTVHATVVYDGLTLTDLAVAVAAGTDAKIGPLSPTTFGRLAPSTDATRAYVDYSSGTSVTRGVFSL